MGAAFEETCREFVRCTDRLPFPPERVGEWWSAAADSQIDVVVLGEGGRILVGECKWGTVSSADLRALRARAERLVDELEGVASVTPCLFSGRGLADEEVGAEVAAGRALHFSADDLFAVRGGDA
jgi:hypothetical protein